MKPLYRQNNHYIGKSTTSRLTYRLVTKSVPCRLDSTYRLENLALEAKCFSLSRSKAEYMKCDFSATTQEEGEVRLDGQLVPKKDTFRYLGSMLQKNRDIDKDVSQN
jgi:hypothetical protein